MKQARIPAYWLTPEPRKPFRSSDGAVYIRPEAGGPIRRLTPKPLRSKKRWAEFIRNKRQMAKTVRREKFCRELEQKLKS